MIVEKFYSISTLWTNEILKVSNYLQNNFRLYKKRCDLFSLGCSGYIVTLFVKDFTLNLLGTSKYSSNELLVKSVALPWIVT